MAKDMLGELGLDVADFEKAIDRVSMKVETGFGGAMKKAGAYLAATFSAQRIAAYIASIRHLGKEIEDMRAKLIRGSDEEKQFNLLTGGAGAGNTVAFTKIGKAWDQFWIGYKAKVAADIKGLADVTSLAWAAATGGAAGFSERLIQIQAAKIKEEDLNDSIDAQLEREDELAMAQSKGLDTYEKRLAILKKQKKIEEERIALLKKEPALSEDARGAMNESLVKLHSIKQAIADAQFARKQELETAMLITEQMTMQDKGMSGAAKAAAVRAQYEKQIAQALKEGKEDLAIQLTTQRDINLQRIAVEEHNMTARQRLAERRTARKYNRDVKKTDAHDADLQKRLDQAELQKSPITPGSELDRFRNRISRERAARGKAAEGGMSVDPTLANTYFREGLTVLKNIESKVEGTPKNK